MDLLVLVEVETADIVSVSDVSARPGANLRGTVSPFNIQWIEVRNEEVSFSILVLILAIIIVLQPP